MFPHIPGQAGTRAALVVRKIGTLALSLVLAPSASAAESLNIVFTCHAATTNSFWQAVKLGFDDACTKVGAKGQFSFVQKDSSIEQQVANMEAVVARKPDALITSLVDNNAFVGVLKDAKEKGITVISSNVDAPEGLNSHCEKLSSDRTSSRPERPWASDWRRSFPRKGRSTSSLVSTLRVRIGQSNAPKAS